MEKAYIFLADGFEEIEGLTVVDILRRAGVEIQMVSEFRSLQMQCLKKWIFQTVRCLSFRAACRGQSVWRRTRGWQHF